MESDIENTGVYHTQDNSDVEGSSLLAARNHYACGNYQEALNLFLNVAHKSMDSDIYVDIGSCYYMMNRQKEALEYWNKAISINPKSARAYTNLGNLYYKSNQTENTGGISVNCPRCGNEMKVGNIGARAGGGLFWLPYEEKVMFTVSNNIIKKHKGIVLVDCNETQISHTAYVCEECRKIIMDY